MTQYINNFSQKCEFGKTFSLLLLFLIGLILTSGIACGQSHQVQFEQTVTLKATDLLGADLMKSSLYTVDEDVVNDGLFNHYAVDSVYGTFKAGSTKAVKQLLHEIEVIAKMKEVETTSTVKDSVVQSGKNTIDAVSNLVSDPQKTLEGAATGISNLFNRSSQVVGKREITDAEDNKFEQIIGKSKSKGKIATMYEVGVYSLNPALQEELERLAWADYLGGIGVGLVQSAVPGAGGLLLSASGTTRLLNEVINTTPASELWVQNKNKLTAMSIDEETVELYLNNPSFSPALQTIMTEALVNMKGVESRGLLIKISLQAHTDKMARDLTAVATMLAGYHTNVAPVKKTRTVWQNFICKDQKWKSYSNDTCRPSLMECERC